jgi:mannose-6-phosphate isomerase-like protein (cupin superfamily)
VVSGRGELEIDGRSFVLQPETAAYVAAGEGYRVHNPGPDELLVDAARAPGSDGRPREDGPRTVRYGDRQPLPATAGREFRHLVGSELGCHDVTQFLGVIPPGRAPMHSHTYDEVAYVVEGEGILHLNGSETPIGPGTCIHLPPRVEHCLENTGEGPMRVLGVFHPAGDPSSAYPANR